MAGRSFEAKLAQDVSVKGHVLLKAGSKAFGKIASSRYNPRKNDPLTVELTSVSVNGRNVAVKTNAFQPGSPPVDGAPGAVWTYRRHVSDYPWNLDAVPASATSDVVAARFELCASQRAACATVVREAVGSPRFKRRIRSSSAMVCGSSHAPCGPGTITSDWAPSR